MQIEHKNLIEDGKIVVYINIYTEDNYEFGSEKQVKEKNSKEFKQKIIDYIKNNVNMVFGTVIVVAINSILIGGFTINDKYEILPIPSTTVIEEAAETLKEDEIEVKENAEEVNKVNNSTTDEKDNIINSNKNIVNTTTNSKTNVTKQENPKVNETNKNNVQVQNNNNNVNIAKENKKEEVEVKEDTKENINQDVQENVEEKIEEKVETNGYKIKLNTNGKIETLELESYIIGVVAAEMPASFNIEALKAQAVAARTFAIKKTQAGATLRNSTADQVYKTEAQMRSMWGSDYSYYYNRIKNAVNATKGLVMTYNGQYIDAQYSAMTNGKTELPEYVWAFSRPYLQCVSSTWDTKVKNFEVTKTFSYDKVSSALGQKITKDTPIEVISKTTSGRVNEIKIGEKIYKGTKIRSLLSLRSTDFTIELKDDIKITTKGFGHGVGMSQYGANVAANEGYSYSQILKHYYVGIDIVSI